MIRATACGPRIKLADRAAHVEVGGFIVMAYGDAKSCVTQLRALQDGRKWSLQPAPAGFENGDYAVWRRA